MKYPFSSICILFLLLQGHLLAQVEQVEGKKKNKGKVSQSANPEEIKRAVQSLFFEALNAKIQEEYPDAIKKFEQILQLDPQNHAVMYELAAIYYASGQYDLAQQFAKAAVQINPDKWYLSLYAELCAIRNDFIQAAEVFQKIVTLNPEEYSFYHDWAFMLMKANKLEDAIKVYDRLESLLGVDEVTSIQKQRLYVRLNKLDKAAEELKKLISNNPGEIHFYTYLADLYGTNNMKQEMLEVCRQILERDPDNPFALLRFADEAKDKGDKALYFEYLKSAFANPDFDTESQIKILLPYLQTQDSIKKEEAFELVNLMLEFHPEDAKVHAIYADLLNRDNRKEEALFQYREAVRIDNSYFAVWEQIFFLLSDMRRFKELEQETSLALEIFPNQSLVYFFNGLANNQLKEYEKAIQSLNSGKVLVYNNPVLKGQFYANLGEAFNDLKRYQESDSSFEQSLFFDPNNANTLNNYSYYLSLRNEKLNKAREMSLRSNQLEAGNPSYEDTYAWVMYKLGDYKEALKWIEKAINNTKEPSGVLLEHLGDILFKLGQTEQALEAWKKANDLGDASHLIGKKIADQKLYE